MEETWGLEYSLSQNSFYSAPLYEILIQNQEAVEKGEQHDFILIAVYQSKQELEESVDYWFRKMKSNILYTDLEGRLNVKPNDS